MRGRIATCSERLPRCEVASVSPQSSESALAGRRGCVPRRQETGGRRRQDRQYCGYFISALTVVAVLAAVLAWTAAAVWSWAPSATLLPGLRRSRAPLLAPGSGTGNHQKS